MREILVSVRLNDAEYLELVGRAHAEGRSVGNYLRHAALKG